MTRVLLVEDDLHFAEAVVAYLRSQGDEVMQADDAGEAFTLMDEFQFDVVISDYDLGFGKAHGLEVLHMASNRGEQVRTVLLSGLDRSTEADIYGWRPDAILTKADITAVEQFIHPPVQDDLAEATTAARGMFPDGTGEL